ncbi:MAG: alpha/beta fold hydrolase [Gammaproteobacteria bacterium]
MKTKIAAVLILLMVIGSLGVPAKSLSHLATDVALTSCHVKSIEAKARCAKISVPEDWSTPDGKHISLYVAVVPPSGGQPSKAPLYVLAGGPGQAASTLGPNVDMGLAKARRGREVILVDQRGTGMSSPFDCPFSLDPDIKGGEYARSCLNSTNNQPEFYNSDAFMLDLDAVRKALGHEQINLLGGSYGTRAALLYLRKFPQNVRSIVLDAVAAPETAFFEQFHASAARALNKLFADCAADTDCKEAYPTLREQFSQVVSDLNQAPVIRHRPQTLEVTPDIFLNALRNALYSPLTTAQIPLVIDAAANGNFDPWSAIAGGMNSTYVDMSIGTMLSVLCGEELHTTSPQAISHAGRGGAFEGVSMDFWFDACAVWPHQVADEGYRDPVESDIPVLLLSGAQDPVTPPVFGDVAASRLSNSVHVVAPYGGHTIGAYSCVPRLIADFLDNLDPAAIDPGCLDDVTREPFIVSHYGPKP